MKRFSVIILFVFLVGILVFVIIQKHGTRIGTTIRDFQGGTASDGQELFPLNEKVNEVGIATKDFVVGGEYLIFDSSVPKTLVYKESKQEESGIFAFFTDTQGVEVAFSSSVLFTLKDSSYKKEAEQWIKNNPLVVDYKVFDTLNIYAVTFSNSYEAYIEYLKLVDTSSEVFRGVSLDFLNTITEEQKQSFGIEAQ